MRLGTERSADYIYSRKMRVCGGALSGMGRKGETLTNLRQGDEGMRNGKESEGQ